MTRVSQLCGLSVRGSCRAVGVSEGRSRRVEKGRCAPPTQVSGPAAHLSHTYNTHTYTHVHKSNFNNAPRRAWCGD